ncbi:hypothetical protein HNQ60_004004 [Povalibacter uvarum]|uniref:Uncharacterized protein n=1 Tax=Povalibacter uvarum TaxID=732238 RepID=A0A841HR55_9GAMM|nr:hypothetical protein [Povalibacter uvarum]
MHRLFLWVRLSPKGFPLVTVGRYRRRRCFA